MNDGFGIGFRLELRPVGLQFGTQLMKILDDAVVYKRNARRHMRMGVALAGNAVRGPTRMADAGGAAQRLRGKQGLQIAQLALGAAAGELALFERRDAGGIIAAIFEPFQRVDQRVDDRLFSQNPDDSAHGLSRPSAIETVAMSVF